MAAAVDVVAALGYRGATADAISGAAGVSKGLLWHYFADLDELLELTARRTLLVLRHAVAETLDLSAPAPEVIRGAIHGAAAIRRTHRAERRAMQEIILNLRASDGSLRLGVADYEDTYLAQEAIFRQGQLDGQFRPGLDPRLLAVTYQGAVDAMLGYLEAHPEIDGDGYASMVADALLDGFTARQAHGSTRG